LTLPATGDIEVVAVINGSVQDLNGLPVPKAEITAKLLRTGADGYLQTATATVGGSFRVVLGRPGTYNIYVAAEGYVSPSPKYLFIASPKSSVEAPFYNVTFTLSLPARITGRLVDEDSGRAVVGQAVHLLSAKRLQGTLPLAVVASATTTSFGVFKIEKILPGDYFLQVQPSKTESIIQGGRYNAGERTSDYPRRYLPTDVNPQYAVPLRIASREEIDVGTMKVKRRRLFRIYATTDFRSCSGELSSVLLIQQNDNSSEDRARAVLPCNSPFVVKHLGPGTYHLAAWIQGRDQTERELAEAPIIISDQDVEVTARGVTPQHLLGKVQLPASAPSSLLNSLKVWLWPSRYVTYGAGAPVKIDARGNFSFPVLQRGGGTLMVIGLEPPFYVKDVFYNGAIMPGGVLSVDSDAPNHNVEVIIADRPATLSGVVLERGKSVPDSNVLISPWPLVSKDGYPQFVSCTSDSSGHFVKSGVVPGVYHVVAVGPLARQQMERSEYAIAAISGGATIELNEGATRSISLDLSSW